MMGAVALQMLLGFSAFTVLLVETQLAQRSAMQVVLNSSHLVVGALLLAAAVSLALLSFRRPLSDDSRTHQPMAVKEPMQPIAS